MGKSIRKGRRVVWIALIALAAAAALALWRYLTPYRADPAAEAALVSGGGVTVERNDNWISFLPALNRGTSVIFYPGGLVESEAYSPLAKLLADAGHAVYIARMPLNLAVIDADAAEDIVQTHPRESFVLGGHSLGGAMAARFAAAHPDELEGVFLLAAYPDEKGSLRDTMLSVLSVLGTKDGVVDLSKYREGRAYLPDNTLYYSLEGGNHAQFGSYGKQKGDRSADISEAEQQSRTARVILDWLGNLR